MTREITDAERIDFIANEIREHGPELYPVDVEKEYGPDENTVVSEGPWTWGAGHRCYRGATFREAIDNAILGNAEPAYQYDPRAK